MRKADRDLLLRVARRAEERAEEAWKIVIDDPRMAGAQDVAKRRRDREIGDARDLKEFVKRAERDAQDAARLRYLVSNHTFLGPMIVIDDSVLAKIDEAIASGVEGQ